jgi:DNA-binding MarR family transcriptional regulator
MCNDYFDLQSSLGFMTITANRLMGCYLRKRLGATGIVLTAEQWGVLAHIWSMGNLAQEELAHSLCVDKSSLSRVLSGMERKGLIVRNRDPDDARRKKLFTTPKADSYKGQCRLVVLDALDSMLKDVAPGELDVCLKVLSRVKATIRELQE